MMKSETAFLHFWRAVDRIVLATSGRHPPLGIVARAWRVTRCSGQAATLLR